MTDKEILQGIDRLDAELPFDEICVGGKDNWHDIDVHELLSEIRERIGAWHYPSKGEYPTEEGRYWVMRYDDVSRTLFADILWFEKNTWWNRLHTGDYAVRAWQYIVPPPQEEV